MERFRKIIYCDWEFLESYVSKIDEEISDNDLAFNDNSKVARCIKELLFSTDVRLFINVNEEKFKNKLREIDKKRLNAAKKGKEVVLTNFENLLLDIDLKQRNNILHLQFNPQGIDYENLSQQDEFLNAMFFTTTSKEVCQKAMKDYGVIVICAENIQDFQNVLYGNGTAIRQHEADSWINCLSFEQQVPCNALIIVDNYILSKTDLAIENLTDIFDTLIPLHLSSEVVFQITIFTSSLDNAENKQQYIIDILKKLRPEMKFSVNIIKSTSDNFHDRNIISNNIIVTSGAGFNLFKQRKSQKTTTISLHTPFITSINYWSRKAYSDILQDAVKVYKSSPKYGVNNVGDTFSNFIIGLGGNRLFELYEDDKE